VLVSHPSLSSDGAPAHIDHPKLWRYVCEVAARYHPQPFHSFRHAVDVLLATSTLAKKVKADRPNVFGTEASTLTGALLLGALVHDVNHPGCMNPFLGALKSPLAAEAPFLERHHAELALALLDRPQLNFLDGLAERSRLLGLVKDIVLATDVTTTMPLAKEISAIVEAGDTPAPEQVMRLVVKAADISNPCRSLAVYERWIDGVMQEFFCQGDVERERGLPISMNCDRETVSRDKCQVGFISFLVGPLFKSLHGFAPSLQPIVDSLESNRKHFADAAAQV